MNCLRLTREYALAVGSGIACMVAACGAPVDDEWSEEVTAGRVEEALSSFSVGLWPDGNVPYAFDAGINASDRVFVEARMQEWESRMSSWHGSSLMSHINFYACTPGSSCPAKYLRIRYNTGGESGMACSIGAGAASPGMRMSQNTNDTSTVLHELGHCLGAGHEHERSDNDRWLAETAGNLPGQASTASIPLLGNYDYDSIMHYASYTDGQGTTGTLRWRDRSANAFSRWESVYVSPHDVSRMMQYYAREWQPAWDFFFSLSTVPSNSDSLPNPYLSGTVEAVGTPAVARLNGTTYVFARGSNNHMYYKQGLGAGGWQSMGCCAGSDPAAVATTSSELRVAFIGADSGKLIHTWYDGSSWSGWYYIGGGYPAGGIKQNSVGYVGPAIASRQSGSADYFVVRADGRLASITDLNGWTGWTTHGSGYSFDTRPAAAALSSTKVQLASTSSIYLYEPYVTFSGSSVTGFNLGSWTSYTRSWSPPAVTKRNSASSPYRVIMVNYNGRLSHRFSDSSYWHDIGGLPASQTGVSSVDTGSYSADTVMNGTEAMSCGLACIPGDSPSPNTEIRPGGIWARRFE